MTVLDALLDESALSFDDDALDDLEPGDCVSIVYDTPRSDDPQTVSARVIGTDPDAAYGIENWRDYDGSGQRGFRLHADGTLERKTILSAYGVVSAFEKAERGHRIDGNRATKLGEARAIVENDDVEINPVGLPSGHETPFRLSERLTHHRDTPLDLRRGVWVEHGREQGGETTVEAACRRLFDSPGGESLDPFDIGERRVYTDALDGDRPKMGYLSAVALKHFDEVDA